MKTKKKIRYTNSPIKSVEKRDRIILREAWLKGRRNPNRSWDIKLGDEVIVLSGTEKGKTGKVTKVFPKLAKIKVSGINLKKRHRKLAGQTEGSITTAEHAMWIWKVGVCVSVNGKPTATRIRKSPDGKRIAVKTGELID